MKRKRIRKIILFSIFVIFVITSFYKLSIEPANYNKAISKQIEKANTLLEEANVGNDKGDYSKNTIIAMKNSIAEAEALIEEEAPDIDDLRKQYDKIKEDIAKFKTSANKNCLSKEEVEKLKKENKSFSEEIDLGSNKKVEWNISGDRIKKIEPINLDIETDTVYENFIKEIAKDNNMNVYILSFRHNGKLPSESDIKFYISSNSGKKYLYKYDEASNCLIYNSELQFKNNMTVFNIEQGGDWILSDTRVEVAKEDAEEVDLELEDEEEDESTVADCDEDKNNAGKNEVNANNGLSAKEGNVASGSTNTTKNSNTFTNLGGSQKKYCTIEIRCDTILNNMDRLPKGKEGYIPKDGVILAPTKVEIKEGENVFDVLKRVTRSKGIQMEFRNDPLYSGAYVEGINHLYEFDGGELSGWMYKVNGWFPNYGCSRYYVKENDYISWNYTCNLGKDVGDQDYWKYNNE